MTAYTTSGPRLDENGLYTAPIERRVRGHSEEVWERARDAYESGLSTQVACDRAGVSRSALFERARREGWRRPAPRGWVSDEEMQEAAARPPLAYAEAAEEAWEQASLALRLGRLAETAAWTRLHRQFRQIAREEAARTAKQAEARRREMETFIEAIQTEAELAARRADIEAAAASGETDEADPALEPALAVLRSRLARETRAFLKAADRSSGDSPGEPAAGLDSPDSPDRFSRSNQVGAAPSA